MVIRRRSAGPWKHAAWTYRRRALTHYSQTAALLVPLVGFALTLSFAAALLLLIGAEVLVIVALPNLVGFRRRVDASLERAACLNAAAPLAGLLARMGDAHRRELEELEVLAAQVRTTTALERGQGDEWLGLDDLLARFVGLAIAHRESASAFDADGDRKLAAQIAELEGALAVANPALGATSAWTARRLAILRHRRQTWVRARDERALLCAELATIAEIVRWTHEQAALGRSAAAHAGLIDAVGHCAKNGAALRELSALQGSDCVDPDLVRLGWRALQEREPETPTVRLPAVTEAAVREPDARTYALPASYVPVGVHGARAAVG